MSGVDRPAVMVAGAQVAVDGDLMRQLGAGGVDVVRRCVDLAELFACAASGVAAIAVVDEGLRNFDRDAVATLHRHGVTVVMVCSAPEHWQRCGVDATCSSGAASIASALSSITHHRRVDDALSTPPARASDEAAATGRVVAVWGPVGSPGRTTVAITLADELARAGAEVLLVDADTYGAAVCVHLGLLDDTSGIAASARLASAGRLDLTSLRRAAVRLPSGLSVLTGIAHPGRWAELRLASVQAVLEVAAGGHDVVVVDVGFGIGTDALSLAGVGGPERDDAAVAVLTSCDHLVAVGSADAVGMVRLARDLELAQTLAAAAAPTQVVVNRVRRSSVGYRADHHLQQLLRSSVGIGTITTVPQDSACDAALLSGRTLGEIAPSSRARQALLTVAARLDERVSVSRRGPSRRLLRRAG